MTELNTGGKSAGDIAQVLQGVNFPAEKEQLVQQAESNHAEGGILQLLRNIPPGAYQSIGDVMQRMGLPGGAADLLKGFGTRH